MVRPGPNEIRRNYRPFLTSGFSPVSPLSQPTSMSLFQRRPVALFLPFSHRSISAEIAAGRVSSSHCTHRIVCTTTLSYFLSPYSSTRSYVLSQLCWFAGLLSSSPMDFRLLFPFPRPPSRLVSTHLSLISLVAHAHAYHPNPQSAPNPNPN